MIWRVEIKNKSNVADPVGRGIKRDIIDLGITTVHDVVMVQVYHIEGEVSSSQVRKICDEVLCDSVIQDYVYDRLESRVFHKQQKPDFHVMEIAYNPGVMDPWEESTCKGIRDAGIETVSGVKTGRQYLICGRLTAEQLTFIGEKLLYNRVIQHAVKLEHLKKTLEAHKDVGYTFEKNIVALLDLDDAGLMAVSKQRQLYLTLEEMHTVKKHFSRLGRNPTDCELETIAQTWSEHCVHKTMRGVVDYTDASLPKRKKSVTIRNLLKTTIMHATRKLDKSWCVSVFQDNAGIIRFDKDYNICFKAETHNHPSALDPYGGAGTGIGGVIRDILGVGMGARPILNTDVFCFGLPQMKLEDVPPGVLHPKRIMKGVVAGVRDYGNRMGIPTANGAVLFDERYTGNPLVYCGTVGIMPRNHSFKKVSAGEYVVVVGGRTGRDGIHGATFSSVELTHESETISSGAVQIGNAITEKKVLDTLMQARDAGLYTAVTDCGAGGLSSAVGEMGQSSGVRVDLDKVPLKYKGLGYMEIWISEAQERMVISVPAKNLKRLLALFDKENVEATVIGRFTRTKRLELFSHGVCVCDLDMDFLHDGLPVSGRAAVWNPPAAAVLKLPKKNDLNNALSRVLSDLNVCSKEWIIRQYDHEVQGMSVLKPLAGADNDGPQDATVLKPLPDSKKGIIVSCGINSRYSDIDPYWMAVSCINEALRQIISVGGDLRRVALLDNFSWGNTAKPEVLGQLVRACYGCRDASLAYGAPFISGKDSLNNEFNVGKKTIAIPPTLLISAIAVIDNVEKVISSDAKQAGNYVYSIGTTYDELGGSSYCAVNGWRGGAVPKVDFKRSRALFERLSLCAKKGLIRSCHDCSDGGIGAAMAEMAFAGGLGMEVDLALIPQSLPRPARRDDVLLFSESNSRFVVEVAPRHQSAFERMLKGTAHA
ncbi:MAG: phosphoribosylformylglycinamidine synthase subunit PurL, partial [Candidatus Omnitrophica bacterium]|nr:phosphoribosylformylglycinamidine synthase subunit PurL [Candidatus Omnitrophota bacterium]